MIPWLKWPVQRPVPWIFSTQTRDSRSSIGYVPRAIPDPSCGPISTGAEGGLLALGSHDLVRTESPPWPPAVALHLRGIALLFLRKRALETPPIKVLHPIISSENGSKIGPCATGESRSPHELQRLHSAQQGLAPILRLLRVTDPASGFVGAG